MSGLPAGLVAATLAAVLAGPLAAPVAGAEAAGAEPAAPHSAPAQPAAAQPATVRPCGDGERIDTLAEPWEESTATYAEGKIRVAALDTVEPAGAPFHLLVLSPPADETGMFRQCRVVSLSGRTGFRGMDFPARKASYDPVRGLTLAIPVEVHDPERGDGTPRTLTVTIDQSTGRVRGETSPR